MSEWVSPDAEEAWVALEDAIDAAGGVLPCREGDPELWWQPAREEAAAEECRAWCAVVGECLAYALAAGERYGVWGARSPAERKAMRRRS